MSEPPATDFTGRTHDPDQLTGLILCSGRGRRMSTDGRGIDKGLIAFRGRPLVEHVIERLSPQVGALLLNAPDRPEWRAVGWPLVQDHFDGFLGPLAGLHAGLCAARTPWLLCTPCDAPLLPPDLGARLIAAQEASGARCVIARAGGRAHPVVALVDIRLRASLEHHLSTGGRQVETWFRTIDAQACEFPDPIAFTNLNTPSDLQELEHA